MNPDYKSFLIVDHGKTICFYAEGIELAIYHRETKKFELKTKSEKLNDAQSAFFAASLLFELNKKS